MAESILSQIKSARKKMPLPFQCAIAFNNRARLSLLSDYINSKSVFTTHRSMRLLRLYL